LPAVTPEECLIIYGRAWFERDPAVRVEVLRQCCTEDIVFMDPGRGRLEGLEAVSAMIGESMAGMAGTPDGTLTDSGGEERGRRGGGVGVEVVTPIDVRHGFFRYSFVWTLPDGTRLGGTDFCELAGDGRMKLITVWPADEDFPLPARDPGARRASTATGR
jgi:hypothetical protein